MVGIMPPLSFALQSGKLPSTADTRRSLERVYSSSPWLKSVHAAEFAGLQNAIALKCVYGDGHSQRPAAAGRSLDHACRTGHGAGSSFLSTVERTAGPGEVRPIRRRRMRPLLCRQERPPVADAWNVFSVAADRLFRGD